MVWNHHSRPFDPSRFLHETQEKSAAEQAVMAFRPQMASLPPPASKDATVITSDLQNGWHNDAMDFPMISNDYVTIFMLYILILLLSLLLLLLLLLLVLLLFIIIYIYIYTCVCD